MNLGIVGAWRLETYSNSVAQMTFMYLMAAFVVLLAGGTLLIVAVAAAQALGRDDEAVVASALGATDAFDGGARGSRIAVPMTTFLGDDAAFARPAARANAHAPSRFDRGRTDRSSNHSAAA